MSNPHLFTVDEWHEMGTLAVFGPRAHIELLDGEVFDMSPIGLRHTACVTRLIRLLDRMVGDEALVSAGGPVELDDRSEPEPDVTLLHFRADAYEAFRPSPKDVVLLIEVAESSLAFDRGRKAAAYSRTGIAEYWIVDLTHDEIIVMQDPSADGYRSAQTYGRGQSISIGALPHLEVAVADVLAPLD